MITDEVFDIIDFSVATPWERFISEIEEVLRMWISGEQHMEHEVMIDVEGMDGVYTLLLEGDPRGIATSSTPPTLPRFMVEILDTRTDFATSVAFSESSVCQRVSIPRPLIRPISTIICLPALFANPAVAGSRPLSAGRAAASMVWAFDVRASHARERA